MNISKLLSSVESVFKKLGNADHDIEILSSAISKVAPIVNQIYPIVVKIAELTPTKTGDQILAAYTKFGLSNLFVPGQDTSHQLKTLAVTALQNTDDYIKSTNAGGPIPTYLLNTALELAVAKLKETV
jgi:hypothetical protein